MARLTVKVTPGSSRDRVMGWMGDAIKVAVRAPPEQGKANEAVIELLASQLKVSRRDVAVVSGHAQPRKIVEVTGVTEGELLRRLPSR